MEEKSPFPSFPGTLLNLPLGLRWDSLALPKSCSLWKTPAQPSQEVRKD